MRPDFARACTHLGSPPRFQRFRWLIPDLVGSAARWCEWRAADLSQTERHVLERADARPLLTENPATRDESARVGLIHADLRPSNILTVADELTVIDFDELRLRLLPVRLRKAHQQLVMLQT